MYERRFSKRLHRSGKFDLSSSASDGDDDATPTDWMAQIVKTTDGGKTWTTVFEDEGNFYLNGIDCFDENTCVAVGESDADSPSPGSRIFTTVDGGATWNLSLLVSDPQESLMNVVFRSSDEIWAVGGNVSNRKFTGRVWSSTNWKDDQPEWKDVGGVDNAWFVDVSPSKSGEDAWALAMTLQSTSSIFYYG